GIEGGVNTFYHLAEVSVMLRGISAGRELALNRGFREYAGIDDQSMDSVNGLIHRSKEISKLILAQGSFAFLQIPRRDRLCQAHRRIGSESDTATDGEPEETNYHAHEDAYCQ